MSIWNNPEILACLIDLESDKTKSFRQIANIIGAQFNIPITRNACLAKCKRLKCEPRGSQAPRKARMDDRREYRERRNHRRRERRRSLNIWQRSSPLSRAGLIQHRRAQLIGGPIEPLPSEDDYCPPEQRIGLFDLTNETCRWPYGERDYKFCGHDDADLKANIPYCTYHSRMAYRPREKRF